MTGTKKALRAGRPVVPWYQRARLRFWYAAVRARIDGEEIDYYLDKTFVWEKSPRERLNYDDGVALFAGIRREGAVTGNLMHIAKMTLADVIEHVEADTRFSGTKAFYEASFWDRVAEQTLPVVQAEKHVEDLLKRHRIARVPSLPEEFRTLHPSLAGSDHGTHYRWCLGLTLSELCPLQIPGFLWALKRLCFHRRNWVMLEELEIRMDAWFDLFFRRIFNREIFPLKQIEDSDADAFDEMNFRNLGAAPDFLFDALLHVQDINRPSTALNYYGSICHAIEIDRLDGQTENGWGSIEQDARRLLIPQRILDGGIIHTVKADNAMNTKAAHLFPELSAPE